MTRSDFPDFASFRLFCERIGDLMPRRLRSDRPIWIFGAGQFGRAVCASLLEDGYDVLGFVDSKLQNCEILGRPVLSWSQLGEKRASVQLAISILNQDAPLDKLAMAATSAGFSDIFMPWDIYSQFSKKLGWRFWLGEPGAILDNLDEIERTYTNISEEESRRCLLNLCAFRLGQNNAYASFVHADRQYFNDISLRPLSGKKICYIDGGAYNGDTFFDLAKRPEISLEAAYLFEPDPDSFQKMTTAVRAAANPVVCLPLALADKYRMLTFNAGRGVAGSIADDGEVHIAAVALDDVFHGQDVDFVKLDVEGAESQALRGCVQIITQSRPVLAISLYHKPNDIWEIPAQLEQVCKDYNFYIRQHQCNSFELVLYAIPS